MTLCIAVPHFHGHCILFPAVLGDHLQYLVMSHLLSCNQVELRNTKKVL